MWLAKRRTLLYVWLERTAALLIFDVAYDDKPLMERYKVAFCRPECIVHHNVDKVSSIVSPLTGASECF